jgi:hypothetical protein
VNHGFARGLAGRFMGKEGMRIGRVYMMLAKNNTVRIFLMKKGS